MSIAIETSPIATQKRSAVIIPALNEGAAVASVVRAIASHTALPVWVIDDASTDNTVEQARGAGARVISLPERLGAWGATQTGLREAMRMGLDWVVTMDSDGQHNPADIQRLLQVLNEGNADVVIGSCVERGSRLRHIAWTLMRLTSGLKCRDLTSGFRAMGHDAIALLSSTQASHLPYQDVGVLLMLDRARLRIAEVTVSMQPRQHGKSRIFSSWLAVAYYMSQTLVLGAFKRRPPKLVRRQR
ncbi:MAG: glycosyltransferase family 2 protein [Proteobacteria bacterium]|jgi:glycosyltransferase involved in cell wall biosynthesis|nr:glycosyltransferase family 2 protein [Pseudomonadota bacterium]